MNRDAALPSGVLAVVRAADPEQALLIGRAVAPVVGGVEITFTVPDAASVIARLADESAGTIGAGTVRTPEQVDAAVDAGATFVVSPHTDEQVIGRAAERGVAVVPGAATPTEMVRARGLGADAIKLFPAALLGGIDYLRAVLEPLPDLPVVVSGGVAATDVAGYLAAGAVAVCLGSALWRADLIAAGDVEGIRAHVRTVLAAG